MAKGIRYSRLVRKTKRLKRRGQSSWNLNDIGELALFKWHYKARKGSPFLKRRLPFGE